MKNLNYIGISRSLAPLRLIDETKNGRIFFIEFIKKDGSKRVMTARRSVRKGVNGKGMSYSPLGRGLLTVFDMDKAEFRQVNLLSIRRFSVNGSKYLVV